MGLQLLVIWGRLEGWRGRSRVEGNVIGARRMESDAENAQVDAVAKIIFLASLFRSDGITDVSAISHRHLVANPVVLVFFLSFS